MPTKHARKGHQETSSGTIKANEYSSTPDCSEVFSQLQIDAVAKYAHEAWAGWMKYMFDKSTRNEDGTITIPQWAVERWERQMNTPYAKLPTAEQKSDIEEAKKICMLFYIG